MQLFNGNSPLSDHSFLGSCGSAFRPVKGQGSFIHPSESPSPLSPASPLSNLMPSSSGAEISQSHIDLLTRSNGFPPPPRTNISPISSSSLATSLPTSHPVPPANINNHYHQNGNNYLSPHSEEKCLSPQTLKVG